MPELPEVETVCRMLREGRRTTRRAGACRCVGGNAENGEAIPAAPGHRISAGRILWKRTLVTPSSTEFARRVRGQRILAVARRGKFIVLQLSRDALLVHLRMGGGLQMEPRALPLPPHCRMVLDLGSRWRLAFCNPRKFGRAWLTESPETILGELGPEPLERDFTAARFAAALAVRSRRIKPLLLDQGFLAGLGNIYVDESLHRAGIHPLTPADALTARQARDLWRSIRHLLRRAIRAGGTTFDSAYGGGEYFRQLHVYQQTGRPCRRCGTPIERILVAQRGTHVCPACQPLRP